MDDLGRDMHSMRLIEEKLFDTDRITDDNIRDLLRNLGLLICSTNYDDHSIKERNKLINRILNLRIRNDKVVNDLIKIRNELFWMEKDKDLSRLDTMWRYYLDMLNGLFNLYAILQHTEKQPEWYESVERTKDNFDIFATNLSGTGDIELFTIGAFLSGRGIRKSDALASADTLISRSGLWGKVRGRKLTLKNIRHHCANNNLDAAWALYLKFLEDVGKIDRDMF